VLTSHLLPIQDTDARHEKQSTVYFYNIVGWSTNYVERTVWFYLTFIPVYTLVYNSLICIHHD